MIQLTVPKWNTFVTCSKTFHALVFNSLYYNLMSKRTIKYRFVFSTRRVRSKYRFSVYMFKIKIYMLILFNGFLSPSYILIKYIYDLDSVPYSIW